MGTVRTPAVAGAFYPGRREGLAAALAELIPAARPARPAHGVLVPHAGYVYSGAAAGRTFAEAAIPARVVLLGPNHTGRGAALAAAPEDEWLTPLGKVAIARDLLEKIVAADPDVVFDGAAHRAEHCLEVQAPFLQTLRPDVALAPIVVGTNRLEALLRLGEALADVIAKEADKPLVVISSDMTHYRPAAFAERQDKLALDRAAALDAEGLHRVVEERDISMCGAAPATAALAAFRRLGAASGKLVVYTHSGAVTGDDREVVAYAGMVFPA